MWPWSVGVWCRKPRLNRVIDPALSRSRQQSRKSIKGRPNDASSAETQGDGVKEYPDCQALVGLGNIIALPQPDGRMLYRMDYTPLPGPIAAIPDDQRGGWTEELDTAEPAPNERFRQFAHGPVLGFGPQRHGASERHVVVR